jgi:DNA-binding HxlR family transcriptional regulator
LRRKSFEHSECAIARTLDVVGDWWTLLILRDAFEGLRRFGEFQRSLGIPKNILTARLKTMVSTGILEVLPASDGSAYQEYSLTPKGTSLFPVMVALRQWGEQQLFAESAPPKATLIDRKRGRPVQLLELRSDDGRLLGFEDTVVAHGR